jgi:hypothetical protein
MVIRLGEKRGRLWIGGVKSSLGGVSEGSVARYSCALILHLCFALRFYRIPSAYQQDDPGRHISACHILYSSVWPTGLSYVDQCMCMKSLIMYYHTYAT